MDRPSRPPPVALADNEGAARGLSLHTITILDLLEHDPRPTFVLDGRKLGDDNSRNNTTTSTASTTSSLACWNQALAGIDDGRLLANIKAADDNVTVIIVAEEQRPVRSEFYAWVHGRDDFNKSCTFRGYKWTKFVIARQWIVVAGSVLEHPRCWTKAQSEDVAIAGGVSPQYKDIAIARDASRSAIAPFDQIGRSIPTKISRHIAWVRSIDWSQTSIGPISHWSPQLRSVANLVMQDPQPAIIFWGPDLAMLYNEAYVELLGSLHPCVGLGARAVLASVWSENFEPLIVRNLNGETVEQKDLATHINRNGFLEESYFSIKFIPIMDSDGATVGHYEPLAETTQEVVSRRLSQTLAQLSEDLPRARDVESYWALATEVFARNDKDIVFVLLYSVESDSNASTSTTEGLSGEHRKCSLRGSVGLPAGSPAAPGYLDLRADAGFTPYFRQAMTAQEPVIIRFDESLAAASLIRGATCRGFGDSCRAAAVCSLNPTSSKDNILGFMVVGLNPRRPYDNHYRHFLSIASRTMSTSLTSILLHEEDINHRERAIASAEAMGLELKQQLLKTQQEVERSVLSFQRFAEGADIGIFILGLNGIYSYRNEAWYRILGAGDRDIQLGSAWEALIDDEYIPIGQARFQALMDTKEHQSFELRLKRTALQSIGDSEPFQEPMWVLCSIFPDMKSDGEVDAMIGCFADISRQKMGEKVQATHALNAQESKRQLESFIDTTSHEMRNPLSAIVQCADVIISAHKSFRASTNNRQEYQSISESTIDAAEIIVQCSKHMKTIVDDVLTLSKLDSGLFAMTPVDVQLDSIARNAVKMFEGEARSAGVELDICLEESCRALGVETVSLDPTRVLQILINLVTNAIKFTRLEKTRHVTVGLGVALERPLQCAQGQVQFARTSEALEVLSLRTDWNQGKSVYVIFTVRDTGRGLSDPERNLLFTRFSQASPRTHIDYGGSGLGLFISRRLTEMHGGAIGFASKAGVGSTFAFYVRGRNSTSSRREDASSTALPELSIRTRTGSLSNHEPDDAGPPPVHLAVNEVAASDLYVLVVEDNIVNQRVLAKQLRNLGINVAVANHGGEALDYLRTTTYWVADEARSNKLSLILMDWEMPVMDGLTCVRRIRELEQQGAVHKRVPVIAVTANVRVEQIKIATEAGMDSVVSKPFRMPELITCMQKTLKTAVRL